MIEGKKDFLTVQDFSPQALRGLIQLAIKMKKDKRLYSDALKDKKLGMIFEKSSTRTRVSFEVGMYELGGMALFLSSRDIQLGRGEPISDTAKVLSRYVDGLMIRTFQQEIVEELGREGTIPVINGLTDLLHPCQAMCDFQTILEIKGTLDNIKLTFIGDGNNMAHSLGLLASKLGVDFSIASPEDYQMDRKITEMIMKNAEQSGSKIFLTTDTYAAIENADVVYTDVFTSMGQEEETEKRLKAFTGYQVNAELTGYAKSDYIFLHCLPAHRGEEVSTEVADGSHSVIFDQAENRLHAQKAIMVELMKD